MRSIIIYLLLCIGSMLRAAEIVALCIGNNAYQRVEDQLDTPVNDAELMKATLEALPSGADVKLLTDATREEIQIALNELKVRARGAKLALVFYSGHGMDGQPDGFASEDTFLLPVDAIIPDVNYLDTRAVSLTSVLNTLKNTTVTARAVILDCCRSGAPKATAALAGATKNFGDLDERVKAALGKAVVPDATLVAFAASPGRKAAAFLSESDENSPFTKFLTDELATGTGNLRDLVEAAAQTTETRTGKRQMPFVSYTGAASAIQSIVFRSRGTSEGGTSARPANLVEIDKQDLESMKEEIKRMKEEIAIVREEGHKPVVHVKDQKPDNRQREAESSLSEFISGWFKNQASNSVVDWVSDFTESPKYVYWEGIGGAPNSFLHEDRGKLTRRYPSRQYSQLGKAAVEWFDNFSRAILVISYHYEYQGTKITRGNSFVTMQLSQASGLWKISSFDEEVRKNVYAPRDNSDITSMQMPEPAQDGVTVSDEMVRQFVMGWVRNNSSNDPDDWVSDFDTSVTYCYKEGGAATHSYLRADRTKLIDRYPSRKYEITNANFDRLKSGLISLSITYRYYYGTSTSGGCSVSMTLRPTGAGLLIISFDEQVVRR